jgi:hypothetical protein
LKNFKEIYEMTKHYEILQIITDCFTDVLPRKKAKVKHSGKTEEIYDYNKDNIRQEEKSCD